jgi:probable rRNA maturation factor
MSNVEVVINGKGLPSVHENDLRELLKFIQLEVDPSLENNWLVSLKYVTAEEMQSLNFKYRNKSQPTNVLSFPNSLSRSVQGSFLGDLAICVDVVLKEAKEQGKKPQDHLSHLFVHGVLHLCGYDHEKDVSAIVMEGYEKKILLEIDVADPY